MDFRRPQIGPQEYLTKELVVLVITHLRAQRVRRGQQIFLHVEEVLDVRLVGQADAVALTPVDHLADELRPARQSQTRREAGTDEGDRVLPRDMRHQGVWYYRFHTLTFRLLLALYHKVVAVSRC